MNVKNTGFKNITIPFSLSTGIKIDKIKKDNISLKLNNINFEKNKKDKEIYDYELEKSSEIRNLTNKIFKTKSKNDNIFEKDKKIEKKENNFLNKLIDLKKNTNIFKDNINEKNDYNEAIKNSKESKINYNEKIELKDLEKFFMEYNSILSENKKIKKSLILQQILVNEMKNDINNLKVERDKNKNEQIMIEQKNINGDNNYLDILNEKNNLIKELQNQNMNLINENHSLKERLNKSNEIIGSKTIFINDLYKNIINISKFFSTFNKKNKILINSDFFVNINTDKPNKNINIKEKIDFINKFIDVLKEEIQILLNEIKPNKNNNEKNNNNSEKDLNNGNGLNVKEKEVNKAKNKKNKLNFNNFKLNDRLENSLLTKNNRYIFSNTDLSLTESTNNKMKTMYNNSKINLKKKLLERDYAILKSNYITNSYNSLNSSNDNIKKEIDLNDKVKQLTELINNNKKIKFFHKNKLLKIPKPKYPINKTTNLISEDKINKNPKFEYLKTDINDNSKTNKIDFEYIKFNEIFKNINNSNILSSHINYKENSIKINKDLDNKYKTKNIRSPTFLKIKNIKEVNGLANEVMKPSFLKTDVSLSLNNDDKDTDNYIFKDIKKYEILKKK